MNKPVILVVEDEALLAADLVNTLSSLGYMVHDPVATGEDAIRAVKNQKPDLVLMDIELLDEMNGIVAAEKIRAIADIPIVYLTAYTDDLRLKQARLTEPYGYIVKPAHSRELHATIQMALYKHGLDRKLKESEEKFRAIFAAESDGIFLVDKESGIIIDCNDAITLMYGYRKEEAVGQPNTVMSAEPDATRAATQKIESFIPVRYHKRKDGSIFPVEITANVIMIKGRDVIIAAVRDITAREYAEKALALASRKLTLLSGMTRHDINNQLLTLNGFLCILQRKVPDPTLEDYFTKITKASERIAAMIKFTKEYEKIGVSAPVWNDCCTLIDTAAKQAPLGKIMVKNDLPPGTEVFADPLVFKVCYNLMDNAVRYGGKITTIRFSAEEHDGNCVMVCEDDGDSIIAEDKERIFDRGFGKNTGLGLALAREILDITGITIRETGEPGRGARFEMTVPKGAWRIGSVQLNQKRMAE